MSRIRPLLMLPILALSIAPGSGESFPTIQNILRADKKSQKAGKMGKKKNRKHSKRKKR